MLPIVEGCFLFKDQGNKENPKKDRADRQNHKKRRSVMDGMMPVMRITPNARQVVARMNNVLVGFVINYKCFSQDKGSL